MASNGKFKRHSEVYNVIKTSPLRKRQGSIEAPSDLQKSGNIVAGRTRNTVAYATTSGISDSPKRLAASRGEKDSDRYNYYNPYSKC